MALDRLDACDYDTPYPQWGVENRGDELLQHQQKRLAKYILDSHARHRGSALLPSWAVKYSPYAHLLGCLRYLWPQSSRTFSDSPIWAIWFSSKDRVCVDLHRVKNRSEVQVEILVTRKRQPNRPLWVVLVFAKILWWFLVEGSRQIWMSSYSGSRGLYIIFGIWKA